MQQHQFKSLESAMKYLEERDQGKTLKFWGWMGNLEGYYFYTFTAQTGIHYELEVHKNGLVRIRE